MTDADILKRIDELLAKPADEDPQLASETLHGTISLMCSVYGSESTQVGVLRGYIADFYKRKNPDAAYQIGELHQTARGALENLRAELAQGLAGNLRRELTAEVLTDLLQLAKVSLGESGDGAKNVAAVLAAAAFEDTIRRLGASAGVVGRDDLQDVLTKLKETGILKSPQLGIAQSYLSFRNHALHANWEDIDRTSVQSVIGLVEGLLVKHFS